MMYFLYVVKKMKTRRKFSKNCSIQGKNREISCPHNFWTPWKINFPDIWNWNYWTLFGSGIEVGEGAWPPNPAQWLHPWTNVTKSQIIRPKNWTILTKPEESMRVDKKKGAQYLEPSGIMK